MSKMLPLVVISLSIVGCGNGGNIDEDISGSNPALLGANIPVAFTTLQASVDLERSTQYLWDVRAITDVGTGEWSSAQEFSIYENEALALANEISQIDSFDINPELFDDSLPVPTVVSHNPVGSIVELNPTFTWSPVVGATTYEVRILDKSLGVPVFNDIFSAQTICSDTSCEVESRDESSGISDEDVDSALAVAELMVQPTEVDATPLSNQSLALAVDGSSSESNSEPTSETGDIAEIEPEVLPVEIEQPSEARDSEATSENETDTETSTITGFSEATTAASTDVGEESASTSESESGVDTTSFDEVEGLKNVGEVLAFPGAIGYGKNSVGGRSGRVLTVNTVNDVVDSSDNFLSLREAIEVETGPRTIVFSVGGIFDTSNKGMSFTGEAGSNVTVACQSAPSPGVVVRTYGFNVQNGAHDIIFRHCAVRLVDVGAPASRSGRTFTIRGGTRDVILDHMSFSWATDEGFQVFLANDQNVGISNITLSNSIVAEGDADSSHNLSNEHSDWGYHAMGPSCNSNNPDFPLSNCSIVNNFVAHNSSRNTMIWGGEGELKNNVIYNWYGIGLTVQPHDGSGVSAIVDNNLMKSGPNTIGGTFNPNCGPKEYRCAMYLGASNSHGAARYLVGNNYYIPEYKSFDDVVLIDHWNADSPDGKPSFDAATDSPEHILDMAAEGSQFMSCVGASKPSRDAIDARVIQEFYDGSGAIGIGENDRTGGHNVNEQRTWELYGAPTSRPAGYDTDKDGMPDEWEEAYGLNPQDPSDHAEDLNGDGYTNIEEYLAIAAYC